MPWAGDAIISSSAPVSRSGESLGVLLQPGLYRNETGQERQELVTFVFFKMFYTLSQIKRFCLFLPAKEFNP